MQVLLPSPREVSIRSFHVQSPQREQRPGGDPALVSIHAQSRGNLPPMPAIFPDAMAPIIRLGDDGERQLEMMRWGMPNPPRHVAGPVTNVRNQQPALAPMARTSEPLPRPGDDVLRIPKHQAEKDAYLVRAVRGSAAVRLRRTLDALDGRARDQGESGRGRSSTLRFSDLRAQRGRRADPSEGDARHADERRRMRDMAERALVGRPASFSAPSPRRSGLSRKASGRTTTLCSDPLTSECK
jgi:hypothetical protein